MLSPSVDLTNGSTQVALSYEYPPKGKGIGEHVRRLAIVLSKLNLDLKVHVIANDDRTLAGDSTDDGVSLHRISSLIDGNNFLNWALVLNSEFVRVATALNGISRITILHAHDWMTVPAAVTMKLTHAIPFVLTIHSTEKRRCNNIQSEYSQAIESIEDQGILESDAVVVNDEETQKEILDVFGAAIGKVAVVKPSAPDWAIRIASIYRRVSFGVKAH